MGVRSFGPNLAPLMAPPGRPPLERTDRPKIRGPSRREKEAEESDAHTSLLLLLFGLLGARALRTIFLVGREALIAVHPPTVRAMSLSHGWKEPLADRTYRCMCGVRGGGGRHPRPLLSFPLSRSLHMRGLTSVHGDDGDETGDRMVMMEKSARRNPCGGASWTQQTYLLVNIQ